MKCVGELYENYYDAYKSDYDTDDELKEDKKKKSDYKQFELDNKISKESKPDEKTKELELNELPKWIKVSEKRFNVIKNEIEQAKNKNLQARPDRGSSIYSDESYKLIKDIELGKITHEEALKTMTNIHNNIERLDGLNEFNSNQAKVINTLFMVEEIFTVKFKRYKLSGTKYLLLKSKSDKKKSGMVEQKFDKQTDTTDTPELEREEPAAQRINQQGKVFKILISNQMLSRLSICLAQLKAGNNSEKLKNEIRQLLYSLYRSKKLTKQIYKSLIDVI